MKKQFFTFLMMLALVIVAGSAMAQGGKMNPIGGSTWTYTVKGTAGNPMVNGNAVSFYINKSATNPLAANEGGTVNAANTSTVVANAGAPAIPQAHVEVTWGTTADTYNLWIVVEGTSTCSNQRFQPITVIANEFAATITALGTSTGTEYPDWDNATSPAPAKTEDCPVFADGADFNLTTGPSDGSSWVYFRVDLSDINSGATWGTTVSFTGDVTKIEYSTDGSTWSTTAPTGLVETVTKVLVRATLTNAPAGTADLTGTLAATNSFLSPNLGTPTTAVIDINAMPDLSGISFE